MKEKLKKIWAGVKMGDQMTLLFVGIAFMIPSFLYTILGSIIFGITVTGFGDLPILLTILMIPSMMAVAYFFGFIFCYKFILGNFIKIIRKIRGK